MPAVKICGVTRHEDAEIAVRHGAWAIGMNFVAGSPRMLDEAKASSIGALLRRRCEIAGVFANAELDRVAEVARECELTLLQLHGEEGPAYCSEAARRTGCRVVKAFRVATRGDVEAARSYRTDFHLFDARAGGARGGTGLSFDWTLLADRGSDVPLILAGGLTPGNVASAIAETHPDAVDVSSGVEEAPGRKDPDLVARFIRAATEASVGA